MTTHHDLPDAGRITHAEIDDQLPTRNEKDALQGSTGTPANDNRYITEEEYDDHTHTESDITDLAHTTDHGALDGLSDDDHPQYAAIAQAEDITGQWDFTDDLLTIGPNAAMRLGEVVLDLDFRTTDYDTDAELQALGFALSDADSPFPTTLKGTVSGSWSHTAGYGWKPASSNDSEGPGMTIPLARPTNWELDLEIDLGSASAAHGHVVDFGYLTNSCHVGAFWRLFDANAGAVRYQAFMYTNDGDDTWTNRHTGTILTGTGVRTIKARSLDGCISIWDDYDDSWHDYEGRPAVGIGYAAALLWIQVSKATGQTLTTLYIRSLTLTYL